jgi:hypothetical protein
LLNVPGEAGLSGIDCHCNGCKRQGEG